MTSKRIILFITLAFASLALAPSAPALAQGFSLASPTLAPGAAMPQRHVLNGFGCTGGNVSPELSWTEPPAGTRSLALTVYDPDAPTGSGWWHWVVYDIPATARGLAEGAGSGGGSLPAGAVQGRTDFGAPGYGGACPPPGHGPHRYIFTLHALDVEHLELPGDASAAMVGFNLGAHTLGKASLTVVYER